MTKRINNELYLGQVVYIKEEPNVFYHLAYYNYQYISDERSMEGNAIIIPVEDPSSLFGFRSVPTCLLRAAPPAAQVLYGNNKKET